MTPENIRSLKALIVATYAYYSSEIDSEVLKMHVEDLVDLPFELVATAYKTYRRNPKNTRPPMPASIRDLITPAENRDRDTSDDGRLTAAKILQAIARYGNYQAELAREFMGELAWDVVQMQGGWQNLCQIENDDVPIHQAQWRELAASLVRRGRAGRVPVVPGVTDQTDRTVMSYLSAIKSIPVVETTPRRRGIEEILADDERRKAELN